MLATGQEGKPAIVRVWEYATGRSLCILAGDPVQGLISVAFSVDERFLAVVGRDALNRVQIVVWDVVHVPERGSCEKVIAKQISEYDIKKIYVSFGGGVGWGGVG